MLDKMNDINTFDLDIMLDGGISNIAQFIKWKNAAPEKGYFDIKHSSSINIKNKSDVSEWLAIVNKIDNFCKNVRKDCIFLVDGLRPICIDGDEKIVRLTKPENTIENSILPKLKWLSGIFNSSYSAGYCNWFRCIDYYSSEYYWCPPSIKAVGAYLYTDTYSRYWNAPAGLRRGRVSADVIDTAFSPNNKEAGVIYNYNWNYAINYPIDGIILEGQKTFQKDKTAFDRINVRRLFLGIEKQVRFMAKYFTYEQITYNFLNRFKDTMTPILQFAQDNGGINDYFIVCDDRNNNANTVDNNEVHCSIGIKPVKAAEFIVLNFIATSQGATVSEVTLDNL